MRSLSIVMFTTFYPPHSFGGDAIGVQRMARALASRGHRVTVVHDEDSYRILGGRVQPKDATDGVERIGLRSSAGFVSNLMVQQLGRPVLHAARIRKILDERRPDIIWYNNTSLIGGPGLLRMGDGLKVYEAHEHWLVCPTHVLWRYGRELCDSRECLRCQISYRRPPQLWRRTGQLDRALDRMDLIIAKSRFSRDKHREFGLRQQMEVLPYFLPDIYELPPPHGGHPRPYFLFVGRLEKIKGLQDVIPAMADCPDADLLILGDGDYADELKRLAAGNPRIHFLGRKTPEELNAYYRGALALIVPSVCYETFGIILIESFRLGTPVIARRLGPFPEIVEAAGAGALFSNRQELVSAMVELQSNPQIRQRRGEAAREAFGRIWREDRVLAAYCAAFARAAHRRGDSGLARALEAGALERGAG
ncbi:glycosyltransferase involved in cell wall biosynthesis [Albidovulum inexpectatum]|uniref:Glycosyltransferase involved in cell wall biosynthesis n=1 Tax=Albidovulum inexpectatum TaxID=196587 RepID=A0A2S5JDZ4_9RHOB|nr:glycosyltransferase family 4 protein [Albidovulum inexpectatum]PPB79515.1 glycosyltransferase involved in cell wall biosynthesis [Albidovulum inexpectatum]